MPPIRDYYEILGVSPEATHEEIKKSFRRLVRQFHPDVHPDKKIAEKAFVQINEAYKVLSDSSKRRSYDVQRGTSQRNASGTQRSGYSKPTTASRPTGARQQSPSAEVNKLISNAEYAFIHGRLMEAEEHCQKAIKLQAGNARAHAILGDIYNARGKRDKALMYYSYAAQFDPRDVETQAKLERLLSTGLHRGVGAAHGRMHPPLSALWTNLAGWIVFFMMLLYWMPDITPSPSYSSFIKLPELMHGWNWRITSALIFQGALLGGLLRSGGFLGHHGDELLFQSLQRRRAPNAGGSAGLAMVALSVVSFWLALAAYLLITSLQETMSRSLVRALCIVVIYVLVAGLLNSEFNTAILAVGGNFLFAPLLAGWWFADWVSEVWKSETNAR